MFFPVLFCCLFFVFSFLIIFLTVFFYNINTLNKKNSFSYEKEEHNTEMERHPNKLIKFYDYEINLPDEQFEDCSICLEKKLFDNNSKKRKI
ncbi:MAG: hypothetical protein ACTTHG_00930 [Treponemataceae bacterium]